MLGLNLRGLNKPTVTRQKNARYPSSTRRRVSAMGTSWTNHILSVSWRKISPIFIVQTTIYIAGTANRPKVVIRGMLITTASSKTRKLTNVNMSWQIRIAPSSIPLRLVTCLAEWITWLECLDAARINSGLHFSYPKCDGHDTVISGAVIYNAY